MADPSPYARQPTRWAAAPPGGPPSTGARRSRRRMLVLVVAIIAVLAGGGAIAGAVLLRDGDEPAQQALPAGECVTPGAGGRYEQVPCAEAPFRVARTVTAPEACADTEVVMDRDGSLYCLEFTGRFAVGVCVVPAGDSARAVRCETPGAFRISRQVADQKECPDQSQPVVRTAEAVFCLEPTGTD